MFEPSIGVRLFRFIYFCFSFVRFRPLLGLVFYKECVHCSSDVGRVSGDSDSGADSVSSLLTRSSAVYPLCSVCISSVSSVLNYCLHCGHVVRGVSGVVSRCELCRSSPIGRGGRLRLYLDYTESSYRYEGSLRSLLLRSKFQYYFHVRHIFGLLVTLQHLDANDIDIICPIPTHITRRLTRFRHPSVALASTLSLYTGIPVRTVLRRDRMTRYQSRLVRSNRRHNVAGAFRVVAPVSGKSVLLVDDILTTGATANECAKVLKSAGASSVKLYTLAC